MQSIAQFTINYWQCLNADGQAVAELPAFTQQPERAITLYRAMSLTRLFDQKAIALQRTGQLGTYASPLGQEAIGVAIGSAMRPDDVLIPAYRDHAAQFIRGVQDGVRRTEVLREVNDSGVGIIPLESLDEVFITPSPSENHLFGVADQRDILACVREKGDELVLGRGDVLVFVNEEMVILAPVMREYRRLCFKKFDDVRD